ncbi:hypothetical protein Q8A67_025659 [Cirrhinus molitorella]|uniref:Uncharacterized protein n=1 Tax=Cirrhinus molitorella TaxID=172907 RepID=A0AA88NUZ5_9TELE|nr:hypothetical protein Q8A67_025659 [Cirrhinus molitorella]
MDVCTLCTDMYQKRPRTEEVESGEDECSIGIHLEKMRTECSKKTLNIRLLQDCMARTRNERADYMKHHSTKDILSQYPALKIASVLLLEFESTLDANIEKNFLKNLSLVAHKVINECQRREVGVSQWLLLLGGGGDDTFELHSVQVELEAVEKQIRQLLERQAELRAALESSRTLGP